jgi:ribosomal protein S18 acetylase RimI-like enzyme
MSFAAHADPWLAEVMSRPVFRVDGAGDTAELAAQMNEQAGAFYFAKISTDHIEDVARLTGLGFTVVDTNVTFELTDDDSQFVVDAVALPRTSTRDLRKPACAVRRPDGTVRSPDGTVRSPDGMVRRPDGTVRTPDSTVRAADDLNIGELKPGEADAVLEIAGSAFRYSRFHLDPHIDNALAHHIKREWIRNYVLGKRGAGLLVARESDRPIGFLAHLVTRGTAVIDLIAVATDAHGRGAGSALTAAFAGLYTGMPRVVGTQIANVPSIRLYTRLGFALARSQYVLHAHR